jgi:hypothetical protein
VMMLVAFAGLGLSVLGLSADTVSGRFGLRSDDWPTTYSWMTDNAPPGGFRVLWVGDPNVLPADAKVANGVGFALTRDGAGDARVSWGAPAQHADRVLAEMIDAASSGGTVRFGHLTAPAGVRYIVFVERAAPTSGAFGRDEHAISDALARQLDLTLSRVDGSAVVYQNDAWMPARAIVPAGDSSIAIDGADPQAAAVRSEFDGVAGVPATAGRTSAVGPGTLLWSEAASPHWSATVDGRRVVRRDAFGWTNAFALDTAAPVRVRYSGSATVAAVRIGAIALWIVACGLWFATRRGRRERARADRPPIETPVPS